MPTSCAVASYNSKRGPEGPSFQSFPKVLYPNNRRLKNIPNITEISINRRQKWKAAVRRKWDDRQYSNSYVCSLHFKSGKKRVIDFN